MSTKRLVIVGLFFLILTWAGSAGVAYGVVELTGGGPQGEQGEQGPEGQQGAKGDRGRKGESASVDFAPGFTPVEIRFALERLAGMFAVDTLLDKELVGPGEFLSSGHPQVEACIDYVMDGEGSFVECGFQRVEGP